MENPDCGSKIKIPKNVSKSTRQIISSCSVQKAAPKKPKYSIKGTILKIGHRAEALAHAKSSLSVKNANSTKRVKINSTNNFEFFCAKTTPKKINIREVRPF